MKKILLSVTMLLFACGALALGSTGAFFSDTELSIGNTFSAGAIDLKIDNTSYYNGVATSTTSWTLADLTIEKFFDFFDLKPGDYGEDTISVHVGSNDAYLCGNVALTSNDDNGLTEPEEEDGDNDGGAGEGELADHVNFLWWADDGDNVLEQGEQVLPGGPLGVIGVGNSVNVTFSDSQSSIWSVDPDPIEGSQTYYIGKAWCFGDITDSAVNRNPGDSNTGPDDPTNAGVQDVVTPEDGGVTCTGAASANNVTQT